jgi:hypothetical protein
MMVLRTMIERFASEALRLRSAALEAGFLKASRL